jgi:hypothetical protein
MATRLLVESPRPRLALLRELLSSGPEPESPKRPPLLEGTRRDMRRAQMEMMDLLPGRELRLRRRIRISTRHFLGNLTHFESLQARQDPYVFSDQSPCHPIPKLEQAAIFKKFHAHQLLFPSYQTSTYIEIEPRLKVICDVIR